MLRWPLLVLAMLGLIGCTGGDRSTPPSTSSSQDAAMPADCRAAQIRLEWLAPGGAADHFQHGGIIIGPEPNVHCRLAGRMTVTLLNDGTAVTRADVETKLLPSGASGPIDLDDTHWALASIRWLTGETNQPESPEFSTCRDSRAADVVTITLPAGDVATGPAFTLLLCGDVAGDDVFPIAASDASSFPTEH